MLDDEGRLIRILNVAEKYVQILQQNEGIVFDEKRRKDILMIKDPDEKFEKIKGIIAQFLKPGFEVRKFEIELIVGFLYPKLDFNVSATTNHLLKAPFNIHHSSMCLSVPLINIKDFDIKNCLTIEDVIGPNGLNKKKGKLNHCFLDYVQEMKKFCESLRRTRKDNVGDVNLSKNIF